MSSQGCRVGKRRFTGGGFVKVCKIQHYWDAGNGHTMITFRHYEAEVVFEVYVPVEKRGVLIRRMAVSLNTTNANDLLDYLGAR